MPYSFVDLERIKGSGGLNLGTGTAYDGALRAIGENVSTEIERYTHRFFQPRIETKTFDGPKGTAILLPDVISITSFKEDDNSDGTFNVTWGTNDYVLIPYNAAPTQSWGKPHTQVQVNTKSNGTQDGFLQGQQRYEIVGTWGYTHVTRDSGLNGTLSTTTATSLVLSGTVGTVIAIGQQLEFGTEYVYVTAVPNQTSTAVTVERAQQGSTAGTGSAVTVNIFNYPGPIKEAAFIQTSRLWRRKDSAFASEAGLLETGQIVTFPGGLDADVKMLLGPYRRVGV